MRSKRFSELRSTSVLRTALIAVAILSLAACDVWNDSSSSQATSQLGQVTLRAISGSMCLVAEDGSPIGEPLSIATVTAIDVSGLRDDASVPTNGLGEARMYLSSGTYDLRIEADGHHPTVIEGNVVVTGEETSLGDVGVSVVEPDYFPNGVAAGDVDQSSIVLWARGEFPGKVRFEFGRDPDFIDPPDGVRERTVDDPNIPIKVTDISGLLAGTQYYYRACRGDRCTPEQLPGCEARGSFRTPHASGHHGLSFGVTSCFRGDLKPFVAIKNIPDRDLDFFVALGDTVYADGVSPIQGVRQTRAKTLAQFREKNELAYSPLQSSEDNFFSTARASTASYVNIDDHEVINNFAGGATPRSQIDTVECSDWKICFCDPDNDPSGNCDRKFINETDLFRNGLDAWWQYNPIKQKVYGQTGDPRTAGKDKIYRYRTFGQDAAIFMLDARTFRDEPIELVDQPHFTLEPQAYGKGRTMLGAKQLDDLLRDLRDAQDKGITWKFVLIPQPIQNLGNIAAADRFEGYAFERARILEYIESFCIANVVFVSGDIHGTIANNLTYKKQIAELKRYSSTWDISTGPVAYDEPYGPKIAKTLKQESEFENLNRDDQNLLIEVSMNALMAINESPPLGLRFEVPYPTHLQPKNAISPVVRSDGRFLATNTFGWTEFEIDADNQNLTVRTWGIDWYKGGNEHKPDEPDDFLRELPSILKSTPEVVSEFTVTPVKQGVDGESCVFDDDCLSCRCSILAGIGEEGLGQCKARLSDGAGCISDDQCESGRCSLLQCKAKESNGELCLNDNDCSSGDCRGGLCRPSPNGQPCVLDSACQSGRCSAGLCRAKAPEGSACLNDVDCESNICSGFQCVLTDDQRPNGDGCAQDDQCRSGRCSALVCQAKEPNGGICLFDNDCRKNDCRGGLCRPSPNGQPCLTDSACKSDRCSVGFCKAREPSGSSCLVDGECISNKCSGFPGFKKCE
jgi:phosphodiesterase/alkaline phosphatase D-like protein